MQHNLHYLHIYVLFKIFISSMSIKLWKDIKNVDLYFESEHAKKQQKHKLTYIPFWSMGKSEIQTLMNWAHILPRHYELKPHAYASTLQWVSAIDSVFRFASLYTCIYYHIYTLYNLSIYLFLYILFTYTEHLWIQIEQFMHI